MWAGDKTEKKNMTEGLRVQRSCINSDKVCVLISVLTAKGIDVISVRLCVEKSWCKKLHNCTQIDSAPSPGGAIFRFLNRYLRKIQTYSEINSKNVKKIIELVAT